MEKKYLVYLDNCCYSRPYDVQSTTRIVRETRAKLMIQTLIEAQELGLVSSYISIYECGMDKDQYKAANIMDFIDRNTKFFIPETYRDRINSEAESLESLNIKHFDACHVVAASIVDVDYFITVDDRLMRRYRTENLESKFGFKMMKPDDFILELQKWN